MRKTMEQLEADYQSASAAFEEAKRELEAACDKDTKTLRTVVGELLVDAKHYSQGRLVRS